MAAAVDDDVDGDGIVRIEISVPWFSFSLSTQCLPSINFTIR